MLGAFETTDSDIPTMTLMDLWAHIREADADAFWRLFSSLNTEERGDYLCVLKALNEEEPVLFDTLEQILAAFQSAYFVASETRRFAMLNYHRYLMASQVLQKHNLSFHEEADEMAMVDLPKKGEKRRERDEPLENVIVQEHQMREAAKKVQKRSELTTDLFYTQERFSNDFPLRQFRHYSKKGQRKFAMTDIAEGEWETIYHCNGPWNAELLVEQLKAKGGESMIIKKIRGSDAEVMGYKVLHGSFDKIQEEI